MFGDSSFIVIVIVVLAGVFGITMYVSKKRHERAAEAAKSRGWTYHKRFDSLRREVVKDVRGGRSGNAFVGVFEGEFEGGRFYAGTAQWTETTGSGDNQQTQTHHRPILTRAIPLDSPAMRLEKENFVTKIFNRDIKTEWEEFNKEWRVTGDDPRFVSSVLSPTMQQWLMRNPGYCFVLRPGWVSVYRPDSDRLDVEDVEGLLAVSAAFTGEILPFIWQDYGSRR